jgi:hypothetical protein
MATVKDALEIVGYGNTSSIATDIFGIAKTKDKKKSRGKTKTEKSSLQYEFKAAMKVQQKVHEKQFEEPDPYGRGHLSFLLLSMIFVPMHCMISFSCRFLPLHNRTTIGIFIKNLYDLLEHFTH